MISRNFFLHLFPRVVDSCNFFSPILCIFFALTRLPSIWIGFHETFCQLNHWSAQKHVKLSASIFRFVKTLLSRNMFCLTQRLLPIRTSFSRNFFGLSVSRYLPLALQEIFCSQCTWAIQNVNFTLSKNMLRAKPSTKSSSCLDVDPLAPSNLGFEAALWPWSTLCFAKSDTECLFNAQIWISLEMFSSVKNPH